MLGWAGLGWLGWAGLAGLGWAGWAPPPAVSQKLCPSLPLAPPPVGMLNVAANPGHLYFGHIFIYLCIIGTAAPPPTDAQLQPGLAIALHCSFWVLILYPLSPGQYHCSPQMLRYIYDRSKNNQGNLILCVVSGGRIHLYIITTKIIQ